MTRSGERFSVPGDAGGIETLVEPPQGSPRGMALVAHPHPLFGGTLDNKVVQTLARSFRELGYIAVRSNFRGVGSTAVEHDHGVGETEDLLRVLEWAAERYGAGPAVLAGFSFGAYVQTRVAARARVERMVLVGVPNGPVDGTRRYAPEPVPSDTLLIHGELDETVPLARVFEWARPQELPVVVVPGADHFFHRKLHIIRHIVQGAWKTPATA